MTITIYHSRDYGTSRNVLAMFRNSGAEPEIVAYPETPPTCETPADLIAHMGTAPRGILRRKGTPYDELGLDDPALSDDALIDAMLANPILIDRPIVVTPPEMRLCRPSGTALDILPGPQRGSRREEDGAPVTDATGRRAGGPDGQGDR